MAWYDISCSLKKRESVGNLNACNVIWISKEEFFEFSFRWKVSSGLNSFYIFKKFCNFRLNNFSISDIIFIYNFLIASACIFVWYFFVWFLSLNWTENYEFQLQEVMHSRSHDNAPMKYEHVFSWIWNNGNVNDINCSPMCKCINMIYCAL